MFKIEFVHSNSHLVFPKIIIGILVLLIIVMIVQRVLKCRKEKTPFINLRGKKFFVENYDKVKLFGSIILFVLYIVFLDILGFLISSIIFISLFNVLFNGDKEVKSIVKSIIISVVISVMLWYLFGSVFNISLP